MFNQIMPKAIQLLGVKHYCIMSRTVQGALGKFPKIPMALSFLQRPTHAAQKCLCPSHIIMFCCQDSCKIEVFVTCKRQPSTKVLKTSMKFKHTFTNMYREYSRYFFLRSDDITLYTCRSPCVPFTKRGERDFFVLFPFSRVCVGLFLFRLFSRRLCRLSTSPRHVCVRYLLHIF